MQSFLGSDPSQVAATCGHPAISLVIAPESMGVPILHRNGCLVGLDERRLKLGLAVSAITTTAITVLFLRRHEAQLTARAERAYPGPIAPPGQREAR